MKYHVTRNSLGPYCADLYLYHDIKARISQIINDLEASIKDKPRINYDGDAYPGMDMDASSETTIVIPPDLEQIDFILCEFRPFFEDDSMPPVVPITVPLAWCSPKVKALAEVLLEHCSPTFQGIVFVEQRQVAACLAKILSCIPELRGSIRCAELVGHGGGHGHRGKHAATANVKGMGLARQQDVVKSFRDGTLNLRALISPFFISTLI
jgi:endoribonuclease Dicer